MSHDVDAHFWRKERELIDGQARRATFEDQAQFPEDDTAEKFISVRRH